MISNGEETGILSERLQVKVLLRALAHGLICTQKEEEDTGCMHR